MRLDIPSKTQLLRNGMIGALLAAVLLLSLAWRVHKDPVRSQAEVELRKSRELAEVIGSIENIHLERATYVDEGISYSGAVSQPYNQYLFAVEGSKGSALARVRVERPETPGAIFKVAIEE